VDAPYIKQTAAKVVDELMKALMAQAEHIKAEVGLQWVCGYEPEGAGVRAVLKYGRVALEVWWRQVYTNVMEDVA
jgi:hypothetical protein